MCTPNLLPLHPCEQYQLRLPGSFEKDATLSAQGRSKNNTSENAYLEVYSGDKYARFVSIEDDGTFNFILYGDFAYSIEARDFIDGIKGRSQRIKIPQGNSTALKLVIQRINR